MSPSLRTDLIRVFSAVATSGAIRWWFGILGLVAAVLWAIPPHPRAARLSLVFLLAALASLVVHETAHVRAYRRIRPNGGAEVDVVVHGMQVAAVTRGLRGTERIVVGVAGPAAGALCGVAASIVLPTFLAGLLVVLHLANYLPIAADGKGIVKGVVEMVASEGAPPEEDVPGSGSV